jgi:phenylacetic acid degradation protein paaN
LFANLATGNATIVKPHPGAILPLALTVEVCRSVLQEAGFDPNLVTLAADEPDAPIAKELVTHPDVALVDFTGGNAFGEWIEAHARQATVFTEKAGVNSVILDSVADLKAVVRNLSFTLSLYSGQMCTAPKNVFLPKAGIRVGGQTVSADAVVNALADGISKLLGDDARAVEILGAIQNPATLTRLDAAVTEGGEVVLPGKNLKHPNFPNARVRTPTLVKVEAAQESLWQREVFGPLTYLVLTASTDDSVERATRTAQRRGAITCSIYSTDPDVLAQATAKAVAAGAATSCNLVGDIYVNQAAAFSDYHVSGCNPAGNATLTDSAFVAPRFRIVQHRAPVQ